MDALGFQNLMEIPGYVVQGEIQGEGPGSGVARSIPDKAVILRECGNLLIE